MRNDRSALVPAAPPVGMRDLLPPEASARRDLARRVGACFSEYGYQFVQTPPFEHAHVIERGSGALDSRDLLRFVDADSGEVALMRPDITPQIARVVATRLSDRPPPYRLAYEGHVIRRRRGRARRQREIAQAGVECIGIAEVSADVEAIELASRTVERVGLVNHRIELHLSPVARSVIETLPEAQQAEAAEAVTRKDRSALEAMVQRDAIEPSTRTALLEMVELWGGAEVLERAQRMFRDERAQRAIARLTEIHARVVERGLGDRVIFDLGEVRDFGYYTGSSFVILAEGPGEPIGSGGRYDELLGRFGAPMPATGFGLDLDSLDRALDEAGNRPSEERPLRILFFGRDERAVGRAASSARLPSIGVATIPSGDRDAALAYAASWGYEVTVEIDGEQARGIRVRDRETRSWTSAELAKSMAEPIEWARQDGSVKRGQQ